MVRPNEWPLMRTTSPVQSSTQKANALYSKLPRFFATKNDSRVPQIRPLKRIDKGKWRRYLSGTPGMVTNH